MIGVVKEMLRVGFGIFVLGGTYITYEVPISIVVAGVGCKWQYGQ